MARRRRLGFSPRIALRHERRESNIDLYDTTLCGKRNGRYLAASRA